MPTLNKAESARINGAKSRGPITEEGKKRSSLNAVRHGALAKTMCLTCEDHELYKQLLSDFIERLQPSDNVELRIVEQLANTAHRLERLQSAETALFDYEMDVMTPQLTNHKNLDHPTRFAIAFKSLADKSKALNLYLRYEAALTRQYDRLLKQLLTLRTKLPNEPTEVDTEVENPTQSGPVSPSADTPVAGSNPITPQADEHKTNNEP